VKEGLSCALKIPFCRYPQVEEGELMNKEWNGFYVPELVTPMDLNEDGILDVAFLSGYKTITPASGVTYVDVSALIKGKTQSSAVKKWHKR